MLVMQESCSSKLQHGMKLKHSKSGRCAASISFRRRSILPENDKLAGFIYPYFAFISTEHNFKATLPMPSTPQVLTFRRHLGRTVRTSVAPFLAIQPSDYRTLDSSSAKGEVDSPQWDQSQYRIVMPLLAVESSNLFGQTGSGLHKDFQVHENLLKEQQLI